MPFLDDLTFVPMRTLTMRTLLSSLTLYLSIYSIWTYNNESLMQMNLMLMPLLSALLGSGPTTFRHDLADWTTEDFDGKHILFYQGKSYIPKDIVLRRDIVHSFHDHPTARHPGELETYNAIHHNYWWPGLQSFVKNYVHGCGICQQFKIN
jgi:hypothetical protein